MKHIINVQYIDRYYILVILFFKLCAYMHMCAYTQFQVHCACYYATVYMGHMPMGDSRTVQILLWHCLYYVFEKESLILLAACLVKKASVVIPASDLHSTWVTSTCVDRWQLLTWVLWILTWDVMLKWQVLLFFRAIIFLVFNSIFSSAPMPIYPLPCI